MAVPVLTGFRNFLMQGELIVIAVGLVVALAFSTLIKVFTDNVVTPLVNAVGAKSAASSGLGWTVNGQRIDLGAFIAAIVYFVIFMAVIYFVLVVPYRAYDEGAGPCRLWRACSHQDLPAIAFPTISRPRRASASTAPANWSLLRDLPWTPVTLKVDR